MKIENDKLKNIRLRISNLKCFQMEEPAGNSSSMQVSAWPFIPHADTFHVQQCTLKDFKTPHSFFFFFLNTFIHNEDLLKWRTS